MIRTPLNAMAVAGGRSITYRLWALCVILLLIAAFLVRVLPLPGESLEGDEVFSYRMAVLPIADAIKAIQDDLVHPPLYYLMLRPMVGWFGSGEYALRALSVAAGLLLVALTAMLGLILPGIRTPALLASALVAINDGQIFFAQQARGYAVYSLLIGILLVLLILSERLGCHRKYWAVLAAISAIVLYVHYIAAFYLATILAVAVGTCRWRAEKVRWIACLGLAGAVFAPWLMIEIGTYRQRGLGPNLGWETAPSLYSAKATFAQFSGIPEIAGGTTVSVVIAVMLVGLACWGAMKKAATRSEVVLVVACICLAVVPPACTHLLAIEPLKLPISGSRHVLPSQMPWALLTCLGVWYLRTLFTGRRYLVIAVGTAALIGLQAAPTIARSRHLRRIPYNAIARDLNRIPRGTPIYTTYPYGVGEPVNYYLQGKARVIGLPPSYGVLPGTFVLLYRPGKSSERKTAEDLNAAGWRVREDHYYTSDPSNSYGTELALLTREGWLP